MFLRQMIIIPAFSIEQIEMARRLFREYGEELDVDLCFQGFAEELRDLPGKYGPPDGALLLAMEQQHAIGCVALRRFSPTDAEMKRLFVRPAYRHLGLGRVLAQRIIERARDFGYRRMVLDTLDTMQGAKALYRSLGFVDIAAYYDNPLPSVLYFAMELS
ncbi:MAG: GNAT family N-acetyltransferase [Pseudomonadota bacterium]|nr:GNAT family N-acetyltransferase [Pseudomonadota bacterium]